MDAPQIVAVCDGDPRRRSAYVRPSREATVSVTDLTSISPCRWLGTRCRYLNDGHWLIEQTFTAPVDDRGTSAEAVDRGHVHLGFLSRGGTLDREQPTTGYGQRQAPRGESIEGSDGTCGDDLGRRYLSDQFLGPAAYHRHPAGQLQRLDDLGQERGAPGKRVDQDDGQVGTCDRERDPGQSGTGTDIDDGHVIGNHFHYRDRVEQVPVPDPGRLAGSDQAAYHAVGDQQVGVPLGERKPVGKENPSRRYQRLGWMDLGHG